MIFFIGIGVETLTCITTFSSSITIKRHREGIVVISFLLPPREVRMLSDSTPERARPRHTLSRGNKPRPQSSLHQLTPIEIKNNQ
ncbi:unnamed protein product [Ilex paraguariensis]|uniref:Uncharacterized protein n=1 Tax=Ilex paraguariensis TaxID=185542 RepID=A0ABC8T760_9AQUA